MAETITRTALIRLHVNDNVLIVRVAMGLGQKLLDRLTWWEHYTRGHNAQFNGVVGHGNQQGGLANIFEKSLGSTMKGGTTPLQAAIEAAITTIVKSGKAAGTLTSDPALARRYLALGATFVAVGVDVMLFVNAVRKLSNDFLGDGQPSAPAAPGAAY